VYNTGRLPPAMSQPFHVQIFFLKIVRTPAINSCIRQRTANTLSHFGLLMSRAWIF
jgi:hypothetical protein